MKKTISMLIAMILLLSVLPVANFVQAAAPGTYNTGDITVINKIIDNNGLKWTKAPADGSSVPDNWQVVKWSDDGTNKRITDVDVSSEGLTGSLDLKGLAALTYLKCSKNNLTRLDVTQNTSLEKLYCYENPLKTLDVSKNIQLTHLWCWWNQLTALNITKNTELNNLSCDGNQLTALDVSNNTRLTQLDCAWNELTALNVSACTDLELLFCYANKLKSLNVTKNTGLKWLNCSENQLTALDVSKCTDLDTLNCSYNHFSSRDAVIGWQNVRDFTFDPQRVQSVKLSPTSKTLLPGGTVTLKTTVSPSNANKAVTWSSSNTAAATVDANGKVTAKAPGKATITVTTKDGGKKATCALTVKPKKPASVKAKVASATSAKVTWGSVAGASGYEVRRSTSKTGTYTAVKTTTGTSFTNTGLAAGKTYYYKIRAYKTVDGKKIYSDFSSIVSVTPKPLKVTGVKATKAASGQAKLSWNQQANVSGYQIVRATTKTGTYKSVSTTGKLTYTNKGLTAGKTYYYKIRAYKTVSGKKVYGAYSDIKSVKV